MQQTLHSAKYLKEMTKFKYLEITVTQKFHLLRNLKQTKMLPIIHNLMSSHKVLKTHKEWNIIFLNILLGHVKWSLTLMEEHRFMASDNREGTTG